MALMTEKERKKIAGSLPRNTAYESKLLEQRRKELYSTPYIPKKTTVEPKKDTAVFKKSSAFDDGYQFGDVTKTAVSTIGDLGSSILKGIFNVGEGIADLGTYTVANVADLFGQTEWADKQRVYAKQNTVQDTLFDTRETSKLVSNTPMKTNFFDDIQKESIAGGGTRQVAEGIGYVAGMYGTGAILGGTSASGGLSQISVGKLPGTILKSLKVPASITKAVSAFKMPTASFLTASGSAMSQAYNEGATDGEAFVYGLMSGTVEGIVEGLGGISSLKMSALGTGATDVLKKSLVDKVKSNLAKALVNAGVEFVDEGLEEVISGVINPYLKRMTYDKDAANASADELFNEFLMGGIVAAVLGMPSVMSSMKKSSKANVTTNIEKQAESSNVESQPVVEEVKKDETIKEDVRKPEDSYINGDVVAIKARIEHLEDKISAIDNPKNIDIKGISKELVTLRAEYNALMKQTTVETQKEELEQLSLELDVLEATPEEAKTPMTKEKIIAKKTEQKEIIENLDKDKPIKTHYNRQFILDSKELLFTEAQTIVDSMNTKRVTEKPLEIQPETEYDETQQRIADVAAAFKKQVVFLKNTDFGGMVPLENENIIFIGDNLNNDLILSTNQVDKMTYALGHELFHSLKMSHAEIFNEFTNFIKTEVTEEQLIKFMEKYDPTDEFGLLKGIQIDGKFDLETIKADPKKYANQNKALNYIVEEMVANEFGGMITDKKYMTDLKANNPGLFTKIVKALKELFNAIDAPIYSSPLTQLQVTKIRKDFEFLSTFLAENLETEVKKEVVKKQSVKQEEPVVDLETENPFGLKQEVKKQTLPKKEAVKQEVIKKEVVKKEIVKQEVKPEVKKPLPKKEVVEKDDVVYQSLSTKIDEKIKESEQRLTENITTTTMSLDSRYEFLQKNYQRYVDEKNSANKKIILEATQRAYDNYKKDGGTKVLVELETNKMLPSKEEYAMYHRPSEGPRAFDLLEVNEDISGPKDIYTNPQYYTGTLNKQELQQTMAALNKVKGDPEAMITIYRATPGNEINNGDWVTLSKSYAEQHNESQLDGRGNVLEKTVKAKDIRWALDDLAEWGYFPEITENKMLPSKKQPTQYATAAPYYNTKITSDNFNVIKDKVHTEFNKKAHEFAGELGIEIANVSINKGGFTFQEGKNAGKQVEELSYTYELKNATPQQADYFASLLGDLGYEGQEAVIAYNYVEPNDTSANIVEFGIKVNNTDGVSEILKKNGVSDYTIDTTEGIIKILDFDMTNQDATVDKIDNIIRDLGGKYEKITRQNANSRYLDSETRRKAYREWLQTNRTDAQNRNLRSHIEQAQRKITEKKMLPSKTVKDNKGKTLTKDDRTTGISEFVTNTLEKSPAFDFLREEIKKDPSFGQYEKLSEDVVKSKTEELIKNRLDETIDKIHKGTEVLNPMEQQIAATMINEYDKRGDIDSAMSLTKLLQSGTVTPAAQALEAVKRLQKNPYYIVNDFKNMVDKMNEEFMNSDDITIKNWLKEHTKGVELTAADNEYILQMAKKLENLDENSQEYAQRWALIQNYVANKMPKNFWTKVKNFRRMGFLFNPKTMIRNWAGNVMMDPVYKVTDIFGSKIDEYLSKIYGTQRTTGTTDNKLYRKAKKEGTQISKQDYELGITTSFGNPHEIMAGQTFNPDNLVGRTLNEIEKLTNYLMSRGDKGFENAHYVTTLTNLMRLNDVDVATQEMIQLAKDTAAKRTWKNNGKMVKAAGQIRSLFNQIGIKDGKFGKHEFGSKVDIGLGDIILPFIMTPANLLVATYDFSPAAAVSAVRNWNTLKETIKKGGNVLEAQKAFVDSTSKATVGTLLFIIAGALAKMGVITGGEDEDKDKRELDKILGNQPYSVKIGDMSFTYDWAQPLSNIFATMGEVQRQKDVGKTNFLKTVGDAFTTGGDRLLEQSFLQNIRTLLGGGYNDSSLGERVIDLTADIPSSMVPTLFKQFADFLDSDIKSTYDKNSPLQTMIAKTMARIPLVKSALPTKKDVLGNSLKYSNNYGTGFITSFLSPMNIKSNVAGELGDEITDVFNHTGDKTIIPQVAIKYIDYDSNGDGKAERFNFNPTQQSQLQEAMGKIVSDSFGNIFANDVYMNATYDEKAKALTSLMEYSKGKALEDLGLVPNYTSGNANVKQIKNYIDSGLDVSNAIMYDSMINPIKSDLDADGKAISGTLQGKKAYTIMNMQISDNAKDTMLDLITTSKNPETVNTLGKLSTQQQFIEYYSLNRSDTFVMEKFSRDDYDVATSKFNIDGKEFMKAVSGLSEIKSDVDANGNTIENSKKNKVISYINSLPLNQIQKIYVYGMAGYSIKQWKNEMYTYINGLNISAEEKKQMWKQLGLE